MAQIQSYFLDHGFDNGIHFVIHRPEQIILVDVAKLPDGNFRVYSHADGDDDKGGAFLSKDKTEIARVAVREQFGTERLSSNFEVVYRDDDGTNHLFLYGE